MATFAPAIPPDYDSTFTTEYAVARARFGDGYEQRAAEGLNNVRQSVTLTWGVIATADAQAIVAFMNARAGHESFDYTLPGEAVSKKWLCRGGVQVQWAGPNYRSLSATLEEVPA